MTFYLVDNLVALLVGQNDLERIDVTFSLFFHPVYEFVPARFLMNGYLLRGEIVLSRAGRFRRAERFFKCAGMSGHEWFQILTWC